MSLKKKFNKTRCRVTFTLPKKATMGAKDVKLVGEFNKWNTSNAIKMKPGKTNFEAVVDLPVGKDYQFRYLINNTVWVNDWNADNYVSTPFGVDNSVVYVRENMEGRKTIAKSTPKTTKKAAKVTTKKATAKKATAKKATVKKATAKKTTAKKVTAKKATTPKRAMKKTSAKDNLKKIEGVGPKIEKLMNAAGIMTWKDLSKAKVSTLKDILAEAGPRFKMHNPGTWAKQAKMAAANDWNALAKWQTELKGGK